MKGVLEMKFSCLLLLLATASTLLADTTLASKGVKVSEKWIVGQTNAKLTEAPSNIHDDKLNHHRFGTLHDQEAFAKLWKAWREGEVPKIDFAKQFVLVIAMPENARVAIDLKLDAKGNLEIEYSTTERSSNGMTYVIVVLEREGIKSVRKVPLP
jgi:hypothetical protein